MKKEEKLEIISSYREQIIFHNYLTANYKMLGEKYSLVRKHLYLNNSFEDYITRKQKKPLLDGVSSMFAIHREIDILTMTMPLLKESYNDIYCDIMMVTPRDRAKPTMNGEISTASQPEEEIGFYCISNCNEFIKQLLSLYDSILEEYRTKYLKATLKTKIIDDILYTMSGASLETVSYDEKRGAFLVERSEYRLGPLAEGGTTFDDLFGFYSYGGRYYSYLDGENLIDEYIKECYPHLAL